MEVLFKGYTKNWLGDESTHCVIRAGPNSALSIISAVHRADASYGLPDVKLGRDDVSAAGLLAAIERGDPDFEILSVVPVKLLKPDEHPGVQPHPGTGLRTLTCKCGRMQSDSFGCVAADIPKLLSYVADHEEHMELDGHALRTLSWATMKADLRRWGTAVVLAPESASRCVADPHPVRAPEDFVVSHFATRKPNQYDELRWPWPSDRKLVRVDVSCKPGSSHLVVVPTLEQA